MCLLHKPGLNSPENSGSHVKQVALSYIVLHYMTVDRTYMILVVRILGY